MDLVASIYRRLQRGGYTGTPLHSLYRDDVQDFAQAELLMDLRCVTSFCPPSTRYRCMSQCPIDYLTTYFAASEMLIMCLLQGGG
jgi:hypothetical protein